MITRLAASSVRASLAVSLQVPASSWCTNMYGTLGLGVGQAELTLSSVAGPALAASSSAGTPAALSKSCLRPPGEQRLQPKLQECLHTDALTVSSNGRDCGRGERLMLRTKAAERTSGTPVHAGFFSILVRLGQEGMALAKDCPLSSCISGSIRVEGATCPQCSQTLWYTVTVHLVACSAAIAVAHFFSQLELHARRFYRVNCTAVCALPRRAWPEQLLIPSPN